MDVKWLELLACSLYFVGLFALAKFGETAGGWFDRPRIQTTIFMLGCCIFGGPWSYYGVMGFASTFGLAFLLIMVAPTIFFGFFYRQITRVANLIKAQNITSISDFVGARYGKVAPLAAGVTVFATLAGVLFLAFQIKTIAGSLEIFSSRPVTPALTTQSNTVPLVVALCLAGFAILITTAQVDATERQRGLMLVIAADSVIKLAAFLVVGCYVTWGMFNGLGDLAGRLATDHAFSDRLLSFPPFATSCIMLLGGILTPIVWPQQFHVTFIERGSASAIRTAAWFLPLYYVLFALFVVPLVIASHAVFPDPNINRDLTVLALPIQGGSTVVALIGLIGGLSAATAMSFVGLIVFSIMLSNDIILPVLLQTTLLKKRGQPGGLRPFILMARRLAIVFLMLLSYLCFRGLQEKQLITAVGLSAACIMQIATVGIGGMFWRRATARGAMGGLAAGGIAWIYMLVLPALADRSDLIAQLVADGPFGLKTLRPTDMFGLAIDPTAQAIMIGITANVVVFIVGSLTRPPNAAERAQYELFVRAAPQLRDAPIPDVTVAELEATVAHYVGDDLARRSFDVYRSERGLLFEPHASADAATLIFSEHLLASVIGSASAQLIISLLSNREAPSVDDAMRFIDQMYLETQMNRDFLNRSISFAQQGMAIFDRDFRLTAWNQKLQDIFAYPDHLLQAAVPFEAFMRFNATRGLYGPGDIDELVVERRQEVLNASARRLVSPTDGRIYETRSVLMPDVGLFFIFSDVTDQLRSKERLEAENETLERRVRQRTEELEHLNTALKSAKAEAEQANISKTRFLAAASHDLLQPLNAARLYATCLVERMHASPPIDDQFALATNVGSSLSAVEDILTALLDISRLDAGVTETEVTSFYLQDIMRQLRTDFEPTAREKGVDLVFVPSSLPIVSDRRLLRRLLQNLISNAIKYTVTGRVIVGVRRSGKQALIQVWDTGIGIPKSKQREIFQEFERLPSGARMAPGLGLGLSIVERLARALGHQLLLRSKPGQGSVFSLIVPRASSVPAHKNSARSPSNPGQRSLDGVIIAAVDNDPVILSALSALLEGWGCHVVVGLDFADIGSALKAKALVPDVIIADYHLDDGDGIAVIEALRARYGNCRAVLATADRTAFVRERANSQDIRVFHKPLKPAALRALLAQWRVVKEEVA